MSLAAVSKHLKVLEQAGLIERGQSAQYRPCTLNARAAGMSTRGSADYRKLWEARSTGSTPI